MSTTFDLMKLANHRMHFHEPGYFFNANGQLRPGCRRVGERCQTSGKNAIAPCLASGNLLVDDNCAHCQELNSGNCDICAQEPD